MKFRTILADPPWRYGGSDQFQSNGGKRTAKDANKAMRAARNHYSTMSTEEIAALGDLVKAVSEEDCVLILWGTWPLVPDAIAVMHAWGFTHVTGFPWIKIIGEPMRGLFGELVMKIIYGLGFWVRGCSEYVLIGRRGKVTANIDVAGLISENFAHSRKPENIYDYAEHHDGPFLEIFARRTRDGWVSLGNEIDGLDIREALARVAGG